MKVLLTGATGFLGLRIVKRLQANGHAPIALVRPSSKTGPLDALGVPVYRGDLTSERDVRPALDGVDAVVHAAGGGYATGGVASIYRSNRDTTAALVEACRATGDVRRFILVSSVAAQGPSPGPAAPVDARGSGPISHYGRAKAQAEALCLDPENPFDAVVLRPPTIYGEGDLRLLPLFRAARRGIATLPTEAVGCSWIHVEDCADAVLACLDAPVGARAVFGVADGPPRPWPEAVAAIGAAVGREPVTFRVPGPLLVGAATMAEWVARVRRRPVLFTRDKVRDMRQPWWVSEHTALPAATGWQPAIAFDQGMQDLGQALIRDGLI